MSDFPFELRGLVLRRFPQCALGVGGGGAGGDGDAEVRVGRRRRRAPAVDHIVRAGHARRDAGAEEGADALKREVSFEFTDVLLNGVSPIASV